MQRDSLEKLLLLFDIKKKREAERHCRSLHVTSEDLAGLILAGRLGRVGGYLYEPHFREISPAHLEPKNHELEALAKNGVGQLRGDALKAMRKIGQVFIDRSLLAVHLFYWPSHEYWHMFYFDQRDYTDRENHWKHGPHIHYSSDLFVSAPLATVWGRVTADEPTFPVSTHIRYDHQHNRKRT